MTITLNLDYAKVAMKLASLLGRKYEVNILFGGDEAKTDGDTIYLPHWDFHDPRKRNALYGLIFHEAAGHVRHTDFDALHRVTRERRKSRPKFPTNLWHTASNILEDIRIERVGLLQYPGAKSFLNSACEVVFEDYTPPEKVDNHWSLAFSWCILTFRSRILGQTVLKHLSESYTVVARRQFGDTVLDDAMTVAYEAAISPDTETVLRLAERLLDIFDRATPPEQKPQKTHSPPQQKPDGSQGQDGSQGGSDGSQGQDGTQGGSDGSQGQDGTQGGSDGSQGQDGTQGGSDGSQGQDGTQGGSDGSQGQDGTQGGSDGSQGQDGTQGGSDGSQGQDGTQGGSDGSQGQDGTQGGSDGSQGQDGTQGGSVGGTGQASVAAKPLSKALPDQSELARYDVAQSLAQKAKAPDGGPTRSIGFIQPNFGTAVSKCLLYTDDVSSELRNAVALRQGVVSAVSPMLCGDAEYSEPRRNGRAIDPRQLTRVKTDADPKIWRTIQIEDDQSVAVQILIDTSSSTKTHGILAEERKAALALASALEQFPLVETAISHFPAPSKHGLETAPLLKPFDKPVSLCLKGWPHANGGTPLDSAYRASGFNFFLSDKERKILFVITDGQPDNAVNAAYARGWLRQIGVEVYGVVIGQSSFPREIFDDAIMIQAATELPLAIMELIRRHV